MDFQASHEQNTQGIPDIPSVWTQNDTSDVDSPGNFCKSLFYNVKLSIKLSDLVYVLKLCFNQYKTQHMSYLPIEIPKQEPLGPLTAVLGLAHNSQGAWEPNLGFVFQHVSIGTWGQFPYCP